VKPSPAALLLWLVAALLLLLAWMTVTGRLGGSRHGYGAAEGPDPSSVLRTVGSAPGFRAG
jgi:hypothetical protein